MRNSIYENIDILVCTCPEVRSFPDLTSSLPVLIIAIRGLVRTSTLCIPCDASKPDHSNNFISSCQLFNQSLIKIIQHFVGEQCYFLGSNGVWIIRASGTGYYGMVGRLGRDSMLCSVAQLPGQGDDDSRMARFQNIMYLGSL